VRHDADVTILVDGAIWPWRDREWAHLVSDTSYDELHAFAERLGIPRRVFQGDHYDVHTELRLEAIALGATPVGAKELVTRLKRAGLRRPHRHDEPPAAEAGRTEPPSAVPTEGRSEGPSAAAP
jgi:hypothetical protein